MRRRNNWQALWFLGPILLWFGLASSAAAQTPGILSGPLDDPVPFKKQLSSAAIHKLLEQPIDMKVFQKPMGLPLQKVLEHIRDQLPAKAKTLRFVIDVNSFKMGDPDVPAVSDTIVKFPPFPKRMALQMALRLATAKIQPGPATYWVRRGHIEITTIDHAMSFDHLARTVVRSYQQRPLAEILDELSDMTGVAIVLDRRVAAKAQVPITAKFAMSLGTALRLLTDMADLRSVMVDDIAYVTSPTNAKKLEKENALRRAPRMENGVVNPWGEPWTQEQGWGYQSFRQQPLTKVLDKLGCNIVLDRRVGDQASIPVTGQFHNGVTLEAVLTVMTDMAGLRHVVLEDAVYVTSPANAVAVAAELAQRLAANAAKKNKEKAK